MDLGFKVRLKKKLSVFFLTAMVAKAEMIPILSLTGKLR